MEYRIEPSQVDERIREFLRHQFLFDRRQISLDEHDSLIERGVVDSVGILQLVGFLEQEFGVPIQPDDMVLDNFRSVAAMRDLVLRRLEGR